MMNWLLIWCKVYENLSGKNSDRFQYVFPYYEFIKNIYNNENYGSVNFSSSGDNSLKNTNNLKTIVQNGYSIIP